MDDQPAAQNTADPQPSAPVNHLTEVLSFFLRLGLTAFGGPAAHIAIMQNELVKRRKWLSEQQFLDLIGITNLIPGPNSTEMAIHIGLLRAGWAGFWVGGIAFILPAFLIVLGLAWAYVAYGTLPQVGWLLYGIKPVVIAILIQALWQLGRKAIKDPWLAAVGMGVLAGFFLGVNEIALLFGGGAVYWLVKNLRRAQHLALCVVLTPLAHVPAAVSTAFSYGTLFFSFFKIGSVMYGSGYVLLAFLQSEFVTRLGWLTQPQLLDAVAIGQFTPGPFFTTATFIGYMLGGVQGAVLATLGIFLPSFIFVALSNRVFRRLQQYPAVRVILDGVNAAALGLMAAVAWQLGSASLVDWVTAAVLLVSGFLLLRYKINSTWLILGGALAGFLSSLF